MLRIAARIDRVSPDYRMPARSADYASGARDAAMFTTMVNTLEASVQQILKDAEFPAFSQQIQQLMTLDRRISRISRRSNWPSWSCVTSG